MIHTKLLDLRLHVQDKVVLDLEKSVSCVSKFLQAQSPVVFART